MKHLITCIALSIACAAGAQTGLVEFPYNPDADNDDLIGVNDLMALLEVFGNEFSEEELHLSNDSLAALYHTGQMHFQQCFQSCVELPGNWHLSMPETREARTQKPVGQARATTRSAGTVISQIPRRSLGPNPWASSAGYRAFKAAQTSGTISVPG